MPLKVRHLRRLSSDGRLRPDMRPGVLTRLVCPGEHDDAPALLAALGALNSGSRPWITSQRRGSALTVRTTRSRHAPTMSRKLVCRVPRQMSVDQGREERLAYRRVFYGPSGVSGPVLSEEDVRRRLYGARESTTPGPLGEGGNSDAPGLRRGRRDGGIISSVQCEGGARTAPPRSSRERGPVAERGSDSART
jgi:hypothetical protein